MQVLCVWFTQQLFNITDPETFIFSQHHFNILVSIFLIQFQQFFQLQILLQTDSFVKKNAAKVPKIWETVNTQANKSVLSLIPRLSTCHCPRLLLCTVLRRRCCWAPAPANDRYLLPTVHSAVNPLHITAAVNRRDRHMDRRALHYFVDPALHTVQAVSIQIIKLLISWRLTTEYNFSK